jgi:hypothetical protein
VSGFRCQQTAQQSGFMKLLFKLMWERFPTAIKSDRIPLFDVRCWTFDVRRSFVFSIDQTGGWAVTRHLLLMLQNKLPAIAVAGHLNIQGTT